MSIPIFPKHENYQICRHIKHYCDFRGIEVKGYSPLSDADSQNIAKHEFNCTKNGETICIIYIPHGSDFNKPAKLNALLASKNVNEIIIIKSTLAKKTNVKKINTDAQLRVYSGITFLTNIAKRLTVNGCKAYIVPQAEVDHIMTTYRIPYIKTFPALSDKSAEAIWLGANLDDIVCLEYPTIASSELTGKYAIISREVIIYDESEGETAP